MEISDKFAINLEKPVSFHDLIVSLDAFSPAFAALQALETAVAKKPELLLSGVSINSSILAEFGGGGVTSSCNLLL